MHVVRTLVALSVATLAAACASPGYMNATPASAGTAPMADGCVRINGGDGAANEGDA